MTSRSTSWPMPSPGKRTAFTKRWSFATGCRSAWRRRKSNLVSVCRTQRDVARAEQILAKAKGAALKTPEQVYARETVLMKDYPAEVPVIIQAMRIGDVGIAAIPCEVFVEIGLAIERQSPFKPTLHHRAGERLQRLPAHAGATQTRWLRNLAGTVGAIWK